MSPERLVNGRQGELIEVDASLTLPGMPFTGRWLVQNSPVDRVPSHGTTLFASSHAIDFVPVDDSGRSAPITARTMLRPQPARDFPGFGRPIFAPIAGKVLAVRDGDEDHPAHRGVPSITYALTQGRRVADGWPALAGNHVLIDTGSGQVVALCHLQQGSIPARPGDVVAHGTAVGACGNSGNSTEPHLHLQVMDGPDPVTARAIPFTLMGALPRNRQILDVPR